VIDIGLPERSRRFQPVAHFGFGDPSGAGEDARRVGWLERLSAPRCLRTPFLPELAQFGLILAGHDFRLLPESE
jgi:hypothetical protein